VYPRDDLNAFALALADTIKRMDAILVGPRDAPPRDITTNSVAESWPFRSSAIDHGWQTSGPKSCRKWRLTF